MAPPIYNPLSNQIQKQVTLFLTPDMFMVSGGTATLTRSAKGILYFAQAASLSLAYTAGLGMSLQQYIDVRINYALGTNTPAELGLASATAYYTVGTLALTSATLGVSQSTFPTVSGASAAPTVADLLPPVAIPLGVSANIVVASLVPPNSGLLANSAAEVLAEAIFTTPATSTLNFYGISLNLLYNFS